MKKIKFLLASGCLGLFATSEAQTNNPAPYCSAKASFNYNMIEHLKVKGTSKSFGAAGTWGNFNDFTYFNNFTFPTLTAGDTASFEINFYSTSDAEPIYFGLWIDFNHNNTFDASELLIQNSNTTNAALPTFTTTTQLIQKTITIPANAMTGTTRMRLLRGNNTNSPYPYSSSYSLTPCMQAGNTYSSGYDFDVTISSGSHASVANMQETTAFNIYPNPSQGWIMVPEAWKGADLNITDLAGRTISSYSQLSAGKLILPDIADGMYIVTLTTADRARNFRLSVQH